MNMNRVLLGGVVAGVVLFASDVLAHLLFGDRMAADMAAAGLTQPATTAGTIIAGVGLDLVLGLALAWLYAAIRPRFGAGARTAAYAGLYMWLLAGIMSSGFVFLGAVSWQMYVVTGLWYMPFMVAAAMAAGRLYSEGAAAARTVAA